ncbi:MAG TPA: hypothetical protein ACN46Y_00830, partial [Prochlorococcus sp.]
STCGHRCSSVVYTSSKRDNSKCTTNSRELVRPKGRTNKDPQAPEHSDPCSEPDVSGGEMKVQSTFGVGGQTLKETYVVSNLQDAKKTAEQRNPTAKIVAMNPVF